MGSDYEMSYKYKLKLLFLRDILEKYTDADHGLTHAELTVKLREWGISANERTLRDDLIALQEYARITSGDLQDNIKYDEGKEKAHPIRYGIKERLFTPTEVKLIMESVRGVHSLSEKQTEVLLKKLETLCSEPQAVQIREEFAVMGGFKAYWHNKEHDVLLGNIEVIDEAIRTDQQIKFRYFWFNMNKMPAYPRNPKLRHTVSPCVRVFENGYYYLIAVDEEGYYKHYRLDRMIGVKVTGEKQKGKRRSKGKYWVEYVNSRFGLENKVKFKKKKSPPTYNINALYYETYDVEMRFTRDLVGAVLDRFGQDVWLRREDKGHFVAAFKVQYTPQFVEWVLGLGNKVRILKPDYFMYRDISLYAQAMSKWHEMREVPGIQPGENDHGVSPSS